MFDWRADCFCWVEVGATFLKVMAQLTSSPAKTVWPCHWMKTRMLLRPSRDMVGSGMVGEEHKGDWSYVDVAFLVWSICDGFSC
jgi:hypothetical protein